MSFFEKSQKLEETIKSVFPEVPLYVLPQSFESENPKCWQSKKWFKEDFCQGPGNILFVHSDGNIAPCCGFANENKELFIGKITDSIETILQNAKSNKMIQLCFEKGLSSVKKVAKKADSGSSKGLQLSFIQLDDPVLSEIKDAILEVDIENLTPIESLNKLYEIKKKLEKV